MKMLDLMKEGKPDNQAKNRLGARREPNNKQQQQTQPKNDKGSESNLGQIVEMAECSHHCASLLLNLY